MKPHGVIRQGMGSWGGSYNPLPTDASVWLEANYGITLTSGNVVSWADRQGKVTITDGGSAARRPLFVSSVATANNKPGVQFDGTSDYLRGAFSGLTLTHPYTYFVVILEPTDTNAIKGIIDGDDTGHRSCINQYGIGDNYGFYAGKEPITVPKGGSISSGALALFQVEWTSNSSMSAWKNGVRIVNGGDAGPDVMDGLTLGVSAPANNFANVTIMCVLIYDKAVVDLDLTKIYKYVKKFGVSI